MMTPTPIRALLTSGLLVGALASHARAQQPATSDSIRLGTLYGDALRHDPRARQIDLLATQSNLRQRSIAAERLPTVNVLGQAQYQSVVITPFVPPAPGQPAVTLPHDTYDAQLNTRLKLYDPALGARRDVERAQLTEAQARVRAALYTLRQSVNDSYFNALLLQAQAAEVETAITDLVAQRQVATQRLAAGAALPSEAAALDAEVLRRRQSIAELNANHEAALDVLRDLTGRELSSADVLTLPDLRAEVSRARASLGELRSRPEYEQFASTRGVLESQRAQIRTREQPRVSLYGRAGYGKPGLDLISTTFNSYWLVGAQVEWTPWTWGTTQRDREALAVQQQIVATEEQAFTEQIRRGVALDLANIDRLERALESDEAIILLRERIQRETRLRFGEGVITSAELVDRDTDVLTARLARATHRVELAQARANFLTLVGAEVR